MAKRDFGKTRAASSMNVDLSWAHDAVFGSLPVSVYKLTAEVKPSTAVMQGGVTDHLPQLILMSTAKVVSAVCSAATSAPHPESDVCHVSSHTTTSLVLVHYACG